MQQYEEIQASELILGRALAYLSAERNGISRIDASQLSSNESEIFTLLQDRIKLMRSGSDFTKMLPPGPCETDKPYLKDNEDIFLAMLILASHDSELKEECNKIWRHLNDCYRCFDYFCKVMRGYSLKTLELLNKEKDYEE